MDTHEEVRMVDLDSPYAERWVRSSDPNRVTPGRSAFSPACDRLAVKGVHSVEVLDSASGERLAAFDRPVTSGRWSGWRLLWSPDGLWIAENWQQWVNVWDATTGRAVFQRVAGERGEAEWINDAAFHPPSGRLAVAVNSRTDGAVRVFDPDGWREVAAYTWPVGRVNAVAFAPDGLLAAAGGDNGQVVLWDVDL